MQASASELELTSGREQWTAATQRTIHAHVRVHLQQSEQQVCARAATKDQKQGRVIPLVLFVSVTFALRGSRGARLTGPLV